MPGKATPRPRPWLVFDVDFLQQDTIRDLLDEFGAVGPLLFLEIVAEAKKADIGSGRPATEQGVLTARDAALARTVGTDKATVWRIVRHAQTIGLLELLEDTDEQAGRLVARSLKRAQWEPKDGNASHRQQKKRKPRTDPDTPNEDEDDEYLKGF